MTTHAADRRWICSTNGCATYLVPEGRALVCPVCRWSPERAPVSAFRAALDPNYRPIPEPRRRRS